MLLTLFYSSMTRTHSSDIAIKDCMITKWRMRETKMSNWELTLMIDLKKKCS